MAMFTAKPKLSIWFYETFTTKLCDNEALCGYIVPRSGQRHGDMIMLLLLVSLYLLLGVLVSSAQVRFASYAFALTSWPLLIIGLGLRGRLAL